MILVDTNAWIDYFRDTGSTAAHVAQLIEADEVAVAGPVITEIVRGIARPAARNKVLELLQGLHQLRQPPDLWLEAGRLGAFARKKGATLKTFDLLIATYVLHADIPLLSRDKDFIILVKIGVPIRLVNYQ